MEDTFNQEQVCCLRVASAFRTCWSSKKRNVEQLLNMKTYRIFNKRRWTHPQPLKRKMLIRFTLKLRLKYQICRSTSDSYLIQIQHLIRLAYKIRDTFLELRKSLWKFSSTLPAATQIIISHSISHHTIATEFHEHYNLQIYCVYCLDIDAREPADRRRHWGVVSCTTKLFEFLQLLCLSIFLSGCFRWDISSHICIVIESHKFTLLKSR